ncbi:hypothetical protein F444_19364 [Phytophthora nicotianae P1976]|uniref:Uncharacterized protein n=1 Tax=Phytophthora nicotianae P1976 TaxID=1317066 RepID=A0A080Z829_PHYNI|nr:hypothetical protein F444_19364 [Phytophthora nicotianae P1976]
MGDAEEAQLNGFQTVHEFGAATYLMCFVYVLYKVRKRTKHLAPEHRKSEMSGIVRLHHTNSMTTYYTEKVAGSSMGYFFCYWRCTQASPPVRHRHSITFQIDLQGSILHVYNWSRSSLRNGQFCIVPREAISKPIGQGPQEAE